MKMFVQLRQDLERVRNLCYMVSRREKLSRSFFRLKEQTFHKQLALLTEDNNGLSPEERQAVLNANHGPSIYDQFYSHNHPSTGSGAPASSTTASTSTSAQGAGSASSSSKLLSLPDYETLISLIAGVDAKKDLVNGVIKTNKRHNKQHGAGGAPGDAVNSALSNSTNNTNSNSLNSVLNSNNEKLDPNPYKKQFVNGARRRNLLGSGSSHSESESEQKALAAAALGDSTSTTTPAKGARKKRKQAQPQPATAATENKTAGGKTTTKGNRKPLSYLFDSDSSLENATPAGVGATTGTGSKKGKAGAAAGKGKGNKKGAAAKSGGVKGAKTTSYFSDSDELELPLVRGGNTKSGNKTGTLNDNVPIYSDSDSEDMKPAVLPPSSTSTSGTPATNKKEPKGRAAAKEKPLRKSKTGSQQNLTDIIKKETDGSPEGKAATRKSKSPATPKGKGKGAGNKRTRNKSGFVDPTELIVPQREAAKKATESIRSVKQKAKDQQQAGGADNAEGGSIGGSKEDLSITPKEPTKGKANKSSAPFAPVSTLSDSDNEEEKPAPTQKRRGKSAEKGTRKGGAPGSPVAPAAAADDEEEDETGDMDDKDEFDFDMDKDGNSGKNVSYVPQRQAAKKAAEHIRSGLSNIVAARLIIEDEMELARKKTKLEKGQQGQGSGVTNREELEESHIPTSEIESVVAEVAKKVNKDRLQSKGMTL